MRYRRLFETAQDGILILNADTGQIDDVNPFLTDLLGYTREQLLGNKLWEIGPFKDTKASKAEFRELQREAYVRYDDLPLETSAGQSINVEFVSNVYQVNGGKVIQCNIRDITKRKRAEGKLKESRQRLQVLSRRLVEVQETERRHLARELHDEIGQALTVTEMNLQALLESPGTDALAPRLKREPPGGRARAGTSARPLAELAPVHARRFGPGAGVALVHRAAGGAGRAAGRSPGGPLGAAPGSNDRNRVFSRGPGSANQRGETCQSAHRDRGIEPER